MKSAMSGSGSGKRSPNRTSHLHHPVRAPEYVEPEPDMFWRQSVDVRFGLRNMELEPDMAMFGKALGNGYAITAVIGKREVMEAAQTTFISSTFWTERIGPSAALKTLEVMEREKSWKQISNTGLKSLTKMNLNILMIKMRFNSI